MSKIDKLKSKYPNVSTTTFNKFVEGDKTETYKYLEFMLKTCLNRDGEIKTTSNLIELVNGFDELLPYIENKDIYHKDYSDINYFIEVIDSAIDAKDEKSFNREEHIHVIDETDDYLLLSPKTHRGSLKYGAKTRWCTSSRNNPQTFQNYVKGGCLSYLIDKTGKRNEGYEKVAFYIRGSSSLSTSVDIYNTKDNTVTEDHLLSKGWTEDEIIRIILSFRAFSKKWTKIKNSLMQIEKFHAVLKSLDFDGYKQSLELVESSVDYSYISESRRTLDDFINKIQNVKL